jgi:hypothetical protein
MATGETMIMIATIMTTTTVTTDPVESLSNIESTLTIYHPPCRLNGGSGDAV